MTVDVVLRMVWRPATTAVARRADGFIRYAQFKQDHAVSEPASVDDLVRYVKHRDQTSRQGRMFDDAGPAGRQERAKVVDLIDRSCRASLEKPGSRSSTNDRGYYLIVISPKDARGLDMRAMTRAAMKQLQHDAGADGLPNWIAGEHRNTDHPHTHIVLAAKREVTPGKFRTLIITRPRLERMNRAICAEMARQRQSHSRGQDAALRAAEAAWRTPLHSPLNPDIAGGNHRRPNQHPLIESIAWSGTSENHPTTNHMIRSLPTARVAQLGARLARHYNREAEREARRRRHQEDENEQQRQRSR